MKYTEKAMETLKRILDAFESGDIPAALARVVLPPIDVPCARWSLSNRLLVFLSGTDDARGFRQWQEVGRYVRQGAKALHILAPILAKKRDEQEGDEEEPEKVLKGFRVVPVFRIVDWTCDCPDAVFRNGSYEGACKHVHWLTQLFPCGHCDRVMIFSPYYRVFECPDCGEKYRLDAILKQRAARLEKRQAA